MGRHLRWVRPLLGAAILGVLLWRLGAGPFVDALGRVDGWSMVTATALSGLTTVCCAWRWSLVARALGVALPLRAAVAACYRSQFLNVTLPGGVLGDVHRGIRHGRGAGDVGRGVRSVVWERFAGQVVLVVVALVVLTVVPSPIRLPPQVLAAAGAVLALAVALVTVSRLRDAGAARRIGAHTVAVVVVTSAVAVLGNVGVFVVAARSAGSAAAPTRLLPLALLVLLAMGLPLNLAGWGPREGAAAWAFGAAGLGADQGVAVAVVYGVMVLVASLPGAAVLLATRLRARDAASGAGPVGRQAHSPGDRAGT